jgi:hypothetical protein
MPLTLAPMMRRLLMVLMCAVLLVGGGLYATGNPGAAHNVWRTYQGAVLKRDNLAAASLVDRHLLAFENTQRLRALNASDSELEGLSTVELASVLGIRAAVHAKKLDPAMVRHPTSPRTFHAALRMSLPSKPLTDPVLLFVVPLGPNYSIGWIGPRQHAGSLTALVFAVVAGLRIDFTREDGQWRLDYLPAMEASARENERLMSGGAAVQSFAARKRVFNLILAANDPNKQAALWTPIDTREGRPAAPN